MLPSKTRKIITMQWQCYLVLFPIYDREQKLLISKWTKRYVMCIAQGVVFGKSHVNDFNY